MKQSNSTIKARRAMILSELKSSEHVTVQALAEKTGASPLTIRRDLAYLEEQGVVVRYHGGAKLVETDPSVPFFAEKLTRHTDEKKIIADYLAQHIPPNLTVFMNGGTTTLEVMRAAKQSALTIITNNVLAFESTNGGNCRIICSGGEYNTISKTYSDTLSLNIIESTVADLCILGVNGIDANVGVTTSVHSEATINNLMATRCKGPVVIIADSSKIGHAHCFCSLVLDQVNYLITTSKADPGEIKAIEACGVRVILADTAAPDELVL